MEVGALVRSVRVAAAGGALLCASVFALGVALPRLTPFEVVHCVPPGETVCFSGVHPAYPAFFLLSIAGIVVLFFGVFGRGFVFNPVFAVGMIALAYGLSQVVSAVLDKQRATPASPGIFMPLVVIGAIAIWFRVYRWRREDAGSARGALIQAPGITACRKRFRIRSRQEHARRTKTRGARCSSCTPNGCRTAAISLHRWRLYAAVYVLHPLNPGAFHGSVMTIPPAQHSPDTFSWL